MHSMKKVFAALREVKKAEREAERIAIEEYPVGTAIEWVRSLGIQCGVILHVSYHHGPMFKVKNVRTNKEYWISFYDVVRAAGDVAREEYFNQAA